MKLYNSFEQILKKIKSDGAVKIMLPNGKWGISHKKSVVQSHIKSIEATMLHLSH